MEIKMVINIGCRREPLWDYTLVDKEKTTATLSVNHPERRGSIFKADEYWEGGGGTYLCVVKDDGKYRFYYDGNGRAPCNPYTGHLNENSGVVCYAESEDGIHIRRDNLGIYGDNNIILKDPMEPRCGFMVFRDENPDCPPEERYKGITRYERGNRGNFAECGALITLVSGDGIHFTEKGVTIDERGKFDSANVAFFDSEDGIYKIIHRDFEDGIRALRLRTSTDFKSWDDRGFFKYDDGETFQMYTNNVQKYSRAPHVYIGLPVRYVQRGDWTENYSQLPSPEYRRGKMYKPYFTRCGLAVTDCLFMTSRDGVNWHRFDEAFADAGYEASDNWIYGDAYFGYGMIDGDGEHYLYTFEKENHVANHIVLHAIRFDGFASFKAPFSGALVETRPFIFEGDSLSINFRTSAAGSIYVTLSDECGNCVRSCEIFGNSVDRRVPFGVDISSFVGKPVTLKFEMKDAEIYSFKFEKLEKAN